MKIYELLLDENDLLLSGVNAISIVENPAIQSDFIALADQKPILLAEVDKDRQILMGAALIPDKPIYRKDGDEEYYVYFSKETIAKTAEAFFRNNNQNNATLEHAEVLDNMTVFESWIVEDPEFDKSKKYGLEVPAGTWMVSMKVDDKDVWDNYVKDNKVFGFSIEGKFANVLRKESSDMNFSDQVLDGTLELIKQFLKNNICL
jgi:hypothetical protein